MKFKMNNSDWEIREIDNAEMNIIENNSFDFIHGTTRYSENIIYINEDTPNKRRTLYHELLHCYMYEYGFNQWEKSFNNEVVCEISASSHDIIEEIADEYLKKRGE